MREREETMQRALISVLAASFGFAVVTAIPASAQTIVDEWNQAKLPAPPQLKPVKLDPKETALLVMDFTKQTCTPERRKRCSDQVPKIVKFVAEARGKGALIIYSVAVPNSVTADILPDLTPPAGEQVLPPLGPDKFVNSNLEKTLKDKDIKTVVAMGTQAQTSVLHTSATAALKGFKVIVPVDGMSADEVFPELYTAWHLATAARISPQITLTKFEMISF
jgi:nicotinamidase-related amidase